MHPVAVVVAKVRQMAMAVSLDKQNNLSQINEAKPAVVCLDREGVFALGAEWERLSLNALEENAYYCPAFMRPLLQYIERDCDIKALAVYKSGLLIGFLPYVPEKWRWLGASQVNSAWICPFITLTIPLVERDHAWEAVEALIEFMCDDAGRGRFWLFNNLNIEGPVAAIFYGVLNGKNLPSTTFEVFDRPVLDQGTTFDEHMLAHVSKNRRSGLRRNRKRLSEIGQISMRSYTSGPELDAAVEEFMRIEKSGWKGERKTALACSPDTAAFARQAFGSNEGKSITRAEVLYLDEMPVAVSLSISTGRTAFTLKCAYDETYKSHSPGLLLEEDIVRDFLETRWADRLDSATTVAGHAIQSLWNNSTKVGDFLLGADQSMAPGTFGYYVQLEAMRRRCRRILKDVVIKIRDR